MEIDDIEIPKRVAFYLRVSTEEQAEKFGLNAQRTALNALLKTKANILSGNPSMIFAGEQHVYIDDISGTIKLEDRPGFSKLMEDHLMATEGSKPFDVVAVFKIDRFARKLHVLMDAVKYFEQNNIEFLSATESIDTSTPFGKAMLGIMGVLAELERENIKIRTTTGKAEAREQGVHMGPHTPYGYIKNEFKQPIVLDPEAKVVKEIFEFFVIQRLTPGQIADRLKEMKIPSPDISTITHNKEKRSKSRKKKPIEYWNMEKVRDILSDEVYIGIRYYDKTLNKKRVPKDKWKQYSYRHEPIIPLPLFKLAQNRLSEISARRTLIQRRDDQHFYLLSGLLQCDYCQNTLKAHSSVSWTGTRKYVAKIKDYSYYYQCNRKNRKKYPDGICPVIPIPAKELSDYVINFVKELLKDPKVVYEYQKNLRSKTLNIKHLEEQRKRFINLQNSIPFKRERLREQHTEGLIDSSKLKEEIAKLKESEVTYSKNILQIDQELSNETISKGYMHSLELYSQKYVQMLEKTEKAEKEIYELIHMLIDKITIYSRPKTVKDRIAGPKKEGQMIPDKVDIQLNLPQDLLHKLLADKFVVKNDVM